MYRIHKKPKKKPKKGRTLMDELKEENKPKEPPKPKPITLTPEDAAKVKHYLGGAIGRSIVNVLEPIARRDLHPENLNVSYDPNIGAIDLHVAFIDRNTPLWANLQRVMWVNRMTWRFDNSGPELLLVVRWFLPYLLGPIVGVDPGTEKPKQPEVKT